MNNDGRGNPMGDDQRTRSVGPILTAWMGHVAPERAPERLFEAAFARTMALPQLRSYPWHRWRRDRGESDRRPRRLAFAGLGVALVIVLGAGVLLPGFRNDGVGSPSPSPSPSASSEPTASPTASPLPSLPPAETIEPTAAIAVDQPWGIASDGTSVWLFTGVGKVVRIDPATNTITASADLPRPTDAFQGLSGNAAGLWVTDWDESLVLRLDPETLASVSETAVGAQPKGVLAAPSGLWIANTHGGSVTRIDPTGTTDSVSIPVGPTGPSGPNWLAKGLGSIWVDVPNIGTVVRINEATGAIEATIDVPAPAIPCGGLSVGPDSVWVSSCDGGNLVTRIDPVTNTAVGTVDLRGRGYSFAMIDGRPWVSVDGGQLARIDPATNTIDRVVTPGSGFLGGGDVVVAADSLWVVDYASNQVLRLPIAALAA